MAGTQTRTIGRDIVVVQDARVVVITNVEMPDWEVRQHRAPVIRFDGRTWQVAGRTTADGKIRYELAPWTEVDERVMGREIEYGAAYVAARDRHVLDARRSNRVTSLLRIVSPFIGFLPARTKGRLEAAYGVDPVSTTFQSVFLEFLVAICAFALIAIGVGVLGFGGVSSGLNIWVTVVIGLVSAIDGSTRYSRILGEERPPPGFLEWAFRRRP